MNLTAQQAALAWAQGKRVEAKAATHTDFLSVAPVGTDNGCWSGRVFGEGHENYNFRLAPGETMEEATVSEQETPVDDGGPAFPLPDAIYPNGQVQTGNIGMSLRQHYAGLAMQGLVSQSCMLSSRPHAARLAVEYADALVAELRRKR